MVMAPSFLCGKPKTRNCAKVKNDMEFLTLEFIKAHSRIDTDYDDELLTQYGEAAEETMAQYLNRGKTVEAMIASLTEEYGKVPSSVKNAALMLVDVWYNHRAPVSPVNMSQVPYTFDLLIKPYIIL